MAVRRKTAEESIDNMLRRFKKEVMKAEVIKDYRKHEFYVAPSEKRRLKSAEAQKRMRKKMAKINARNDY